MVDILADAMPRKLPKLAHFLFEAVVKGSPRPCKHMHAALTDMGEKIKRKNPCPCDRFIVLQINSKLLCV